jgi:flagellar hook-length control protein FliK
MSLTADARGRGRDSRDESLPTIELHTRAEGNADGAAMSITKAAEAGDAQAPTLLKLHQRVDTPEFGQALAERVTWLVQKDLNGAKLSVNPPQLGPIEVRIEVKDDQASIWFSTHSALTRDALESTTPKLREMLGAQGFTGVSVDISQRSFQERATYPPRYDRVPTDVTTVESTWQAEAVETRAQARSALDTYA